MIEAGLPQVAFSPIADPEVANALHARRLGELVSLAIAGEADSQFGGPPIHLTDTLVGLFDGTYIGDGPMRGGQAGNFDPTAVVRTDGVTILVVSHATQMLDLQQFRAFDIDPARQRTLGLKSQRHFRAAFEPIAGNVVVCDSSGLTITDFPRFPYRHVLRPIFPPDEGMEYDAGQA
jgi:microcystin degradation protein MlrC